MGVPAEWMNEPARPTVHTLARPDETQQNQSMNKILTLTVALLVTPMATVCAAEAAATFKTTCAKCHGEDGKGETKMGKKVGIKDLTDSKVQDKFTDEQAFKALKEGLKDKDSDKTLMKPVENLTDQEIKDLIVLVRKFKK